MSESMFGSSLREETTDKVDLMELEPGSTVQFKTSHGSTWWVTVTRAKRTYLNGLMLGIAISTTGKESIPGDPDIMSGMRIIEAGEPWLFSISGKTSRVTEITVRKLPG